MKLPDIEIVETTYFKGSKAKKIRPGQDEPEYGKLGGAGPAQYDVKVASRDEVKQSLDLARQGKSVNLFKKRKSQNIGADMSG